MDDNTAIVITILVIVAGIAATSWSRSWASRAANRWDAEQTRAEAELIRAKTSRKQLEEAQARDLADAWDYGYESAARFHEGHEKGHWEHNDKRGTRTWIPDPAPTNPYREEEQ